MANEKIIWDFLKQQGFNNYGIAGLMGNLEAESNLEPKNLQNTYNNKLSLSDEQYTTKVDNNTYTNFIHDSAGYGLAQWTYWSRKQNLLNYAKSKNKSIGDLTMQLEFLVKELKENYTNSVYNILKTATSVAQASDAVLLNFERPANANAQRSSRASRGQNYYNKYVQGGINVMSTNVYRKGSATKLSTHFNSNEFDCHGSGCCSQTLINPDLVKYLEQIREHFNAPITITSGYRCNTHNRRVGGATGSRHSKGDAADIVVKGISSREVAKYAESIGVKGIGLYETSSDGFFTHIDTRSTKSFWYGQSESPRSTFGGKSSLATSNSITPVVNSSSVELSLNDSGEAVKDLQKMLVDLGYTLTNNPNDSTKGIDGIFGLLTYKAVRDFQSKKGLISDGIVGPKTMEVLEKSNNKTGYKVKITASILNVRSGPGIDNPVIAGIRKNSVYQILEIKDGWGKISSPTGWISLDYTVAI